jgi:hypothetical protein
MQLNHFEAVVGAALLIFLLGSSCTRHNEEDLFEEFECITGEVKYSVMVAPIMQLHCNSCHNASAPSGNIVTDNYQSLHQIALNGKLVGVVKHQPGFVPMPFGLPRLDDCLVLRLETWVLAGALNN